MFRDPGFYRRLPREGGPAAAHVPVRAHLARRLLDRRGGLLDRHPAPGGRALRQTRIYATDINEAALRAGARRHLPARARCRTYTANYIRAGGKRRLLRVLHGRVRRRDVPTARCVRNIVFAQHNLVMDSSFNEFHVIVCRNVMIYFDRTLQERVHGLFSDSLVKPGHSRARRQGVAELTPARTATSRGRGRANLPEVRMRFTLVVVGASFGGFDALQTLLRHSRGRAPCRRWRSSSTGQPDRTASWPLAPAVHAPLPVVEAEDKDVDRAGPRLPGAAGLPPAGGAGQLALSVDPPVTTAAPRSTSCSSRPPRLRREARSG